MPYYLGIDGGGSKTTCVLGDETCVLATAIAGPSNIVRVGERQAREALHHCVRRVCTAAGISPSQISRSCIGAAGASNSEVARMLHAALAEILPTAIDVVVDTQIALQAAFGGGPGIIVIAGTGSIAYGRNAQGSAARAGGWGFAISDEGSAHWIGRTAITAILHAHDFDSEDAGLRTAGLHSESGSLLLDCILKTWNARSLEDVARTANSIPPPDFAALFPATLASAEAGDELARDVLTAAGGALARIASAVIRRLFPVAEGVPLAMVGGVFRHAPQVRSVFYNELRKLETRVQLTPEVVDPVQGALNLAREASSPPGKA